MFHRRPLSSVNENNNTGGSRSTNQHSKSLDNEFSNTIIRFYKGHKLTFIDVNFDNSTCLNVVTINMK